MNCEDDFSLLEDAVEDLKIIEEIRDNYDDFLVPIELMNGNPVLQEVDYGTKVSQKYPFEEVPKKRKRGRKRKSTGATSTKEKNTTKKEEEDAFEVSELSNMKLVGCKIYLTISFANYGKEHDVRKDIQFIRKFDNVPVLLNQYIQDFYINQVVDAKSGKFKPAYKITDLTQDDSKERRKRIKYFYSLLCYKYGDFLETSILIYLLSERYLTTYKQIEDVVAPPKPVICATFSESTLVQLQDMNNSF